MWCLQSCSFAKDCLASQGLLMFTQKFRIVFPSSVKDVIDIHRIFSESVEHNVGCGTGIFNNAFFPQTWVAFLFILSSSLACWSLCFQLRSLISCAKCTLKFFLFIIFIIIIITNIHLLCSSHFPPSPLKYFITVVSEVFSFQLLLNVTHVYSLGIALTFTY